MTELAILAREIGAHERSLRRAVNRGTIRVDRGSPRRMRVPSAEHDYVRRRWPLVSSLVKELRTLPNVRLAVLFGSAARGDDRPDSDVDVLVELRKDGVQARGVLAERLEAASGRPVQLLSLTEALNDPSLLVDVLRDGRALVDRNETWRKLRSREPEIRRQAQRADAQLARRARAALEELGVA